MRLPDNVGLLVMGLAASIVLVLLEISIPQVALLGDNGGISRRSISPRPYSTACSLFLLSAGALQIDRSLLRYRAWTVGRHGDARRREVGIMFWGAGQLYSLPIAFAWALVFGALISPTDPIAVLAVLKQARVAKTLEMDMVGESLFNDGVGVVLFTILLAAAMGARATRHRLRPHRNGPAHMEQLGQDSLIPRRGATHPKPGLRGYSRPGPFG